MPLAKVMPRMLAALLFGVAAASCATEAASMNAQSEPELAVQPPEPAPAPVVQPLSPPARALPASASSTARMPSSIRNGAAGMVVQAVEQTVSRDEVTAALQDMIFNAPVCIQMPALWLEDSDRPNAYLVRFDMMARDWGEPAAAGAGMRLDEFIALGFFTKRERPNIGAGVSEIALTADGRAHLRGRFNPGLRSNFCGPSERHVVEITSMEFGRFPCGTLRVHFTHVGDDWPSWARGQASRARTAANWATPGESGEGTVSLSRQWFSSGNVPDSFQNGALRSLCYERDRRVADNDLDLSVARPPE